MDAAGRKLGEELAGREALDGKFPEDVKALLEERQRRVDEWVKEREAETKEGLGTAEEPEELSEAFVEEASPAERRAKLGFETPAQAAAAVLNPHGGREGHPIDDVAYMMEYKLKQAAESMRKRFPNLPAEYLLAETRMAEEEAAGVPRPNHLQDEPDPWEKEEPTTSADHIKMDWSVALARQREFTIGNRSFEELDRTTPARDFSGNRTLIPGVADYAKMLAPDAPPLGPEMFPGYCELCGQSLFHYAGQECDVLPGHFHPPRNDQKDADLEPSAPEPAPKRANKAGAAAAAREREAQRRMELYGHAGRTPLEEMTLAMKEFHMQEMGQEYVPFVRSVDEVPSAGTVGGGHPFATPPLGEVG